MPEDLRFSRFSHEGFPHGDVCALAQRAGEVLMEYYDQPLNIQHKADDSPVTQADFAAQRVIQAHLSTHYPDIPVISEEAPLPPYAERREWQRFWLVDPLDGTKEFIQHNGEFTVNIALIEGGVPVFGVIAVPAQQTLYYAHRDHGAWKQDLQHAPQTAPQRLQYTPVSLTEPLRIVTSRSHLSEGLEHWIEQHSIAERIPTGSSLKFCRIAENKADVYVRLHSICEWDVAAGDCIYRYATTGKPHASALKYNTEDLKTGAFIIGSTTLKP